MVTLRPSAWPRAKSALADWRQTVAVRPTGLSSAAAAAEAGWAAEGGGSVVAGTGAPVLPVFVVMERSRKYRGVIEPPIYFNPSSRGDREAVIREGMAKLIKKFEAYIEKYPDQWYNFYPFWSGDNK